MGYWDTVVGFIWDEPMHSGAPKKDLLYQLKYLREKYSDKRTFLIFCTNEFTTAYLPDIPSEQIDEEMAEYVTDLAFDAYGLSRTETYRQCTKLMKDKCGIHKNRINIWHIPCAFEDLSTGKDLQYAMRHLNLCYDLLKEEDNPGGIIAYSYPTWGSLEIGLVDTLADGRYTSYEERMMEIGEELIHTPLNARVIGTGDEDDNDNDNDNELPPTGDNLFILVLMSAMSMAVILTARKLKSINN